MYLRKSSFQFKNTDTTDVKPYNSKSLEAIVKGRKVLISVWNGYGKRVSITTLMKYNWMIEYVSAQSEEYINYQRCVYMYQRHFKLVDKVLELKQVYDDAGLAYTATSEEMEDHIIQLDNPTEWPQKFAYAAEELAIELETAYKDYMVNVEEDYDHNPIGAWSVYRELPILIKWLPGTYAPEDIPEYIQPRYVINEDEFTNLNGGKSDV